MDQSAEAETTFQDLETDERFKKLQRTLKITLLKNLLNKNMDNKLMSSGAIRSNISSISTDTPNSNYLTSASNPTMSQASLIKSEKKNILTSSNNLGNIVFEEKHHNTNNKKTMTMSSTKQYKIDQDKLDQFVMPPPVRSKVYHSEENNKGRIHMSNGKQATSTVFGDSVQFSLPNTLKSTPTCMSPSISKDYPQSYVASKISANAQRVNRVFSRWKVLLNDHYELIIKGTLECGKIAHSKPIKRRCTATYIESKFGHKYLLHGNIVDETNALPDYVRDKFYNGFPDDWENVHQIWQTYISRGCPVTFHWPTPITDSDDDLKSEMTDLTYTCVSNDEVTFRTTYRSAERIQPEYLSNNSPNKKEIYNCSANNSRSCEKYASFAKSFIPDSENNTFIAQTRNANLTYNKNNEQNCRFSVNAELSSRKMNKLKDYIQEDKLNIIINNLMDKNCSRTYIDKIIEMFDCLNYVASYGSSSECNNDSTILESQNTFKSESIPIQQNVMHDNNRENINNIENRTTELKNNAHSTDLGYESIKNDFITTIQSNTVSIESKHDKRRDLDQLESEIYAGVPKISIDQILRCRERSKEYKRPARRKIIPQQYAMDSLHNARGEAESKSGQTTISITNTKETSFSESYTSAHDEATNVKEHHKADVHQRPREATFFINQEKPNNNVDTHEGNKPQMQNQQFDARKSNRNAAFMKEQKFSKPHTHSQAVSDVDYVIDSNIDMITLDTNMQKSSVSATPYYSDENIAISNKNNSNFPEKSPQRNALKGLRKEFTERPDSEITKKKFKPIITSSQLVNLNLKMCNTDLKPAQSRDSDAIVKEDKQRADNSSMEEVREKDPVLSAKSAIITNDSHSKITIDTKTEAHPNKKNSKMNQLSDEDEATERSNNDELKIRPEVLIAWMPKVAYCAKSDYKLGLVFQGKLLNNAGHVINRNFTTDFILKRLSKTVIETVNHKFYELRGHLNDSKHNIPKKLVLQCRNGCPADIKQFCLTWKTLQNENLHDTSIDLLETPISSRGRKIMPPLCFWKGERIRLKDNNPVYSSGNLQESSLILLQKNFNKALNIKKTNQQKVNSKSASKMQSMNKQISSEADENSNTDRKQTSKVKIRRSTRKISTIKKYAYSSTDSEKEEVFPPKRLCNSPITEESWKNRLRKQTSLRCRSLYENN